MVQALLISLASACIPTYSTIFLGYAKQREVLEPLHASLIQKKMCLSSQG